ncbi:MAG TPA: amidohydrolase family protein [Oscillospiraceae bacterium]|nr:amidohydrolase family protein [Oscillospiraceae bacterium]
MNNIYNKIIEHIKSTPIINTHSHHLPDSEFKHANLHFILSNSYANWLSPPPQPGARKGAAEYINKHRCNSYFRWIFKSLEDLYGLEVTADNFDLIDDKLTLSHKDPAHHLNILKDRCRFERIVNERQPDPGSNLGHPELFSPSFRCDCYFSGYLKTKPEPNGFLAYSTFEKADISNISEYLGEIKKAITRKKHEGCKALKCAIAYERPLNFDEYNLTKAEKALNNKNASPNEINAFGNVVMRALCEAAADNNLPFQIHTGMGQLKGTNPIKLLTIIEENPDTKFHLMHGGFPWFSDTYALLHNYKNVWADTCWTPYLSTFSAKGFIKSALEVSDASRLTWGCDTWTSEDALGALFAMEHTLALALSEMVLDGAFDTEYALYISDRIMYQNGKQLFNL